MQQGDFTKSELFSIEQREAKGFKEILNTTISVNRFVIMNRISGKVLYVEDTNGDLYATSSKACVEKMNDAVELGLTVKEITPRSKKCKTTAGDFIFLECVVHE